jgi:tetratricopeptide (TPR) repeat protein
MFGAIDVWRGQTKGGTTMLAAAAKPKPTIDDELGAGAQPELAAVPPASPTPTAQDAARPPDSLDGSADVHADGGKFADNTPPRATTEPSLRAATKSPTLAVAVKSPTASPETILFEAVEQSGSVESCDAYLKRFPSGERSAAVRKLRASAAAWTAATQSDTINAYDAFAKKFPQNRFVDTARQRTTFKYWRDLAAEPKASAHVLVEFAELCARESGCSTEELRDFYHRAVDLEPSNGRALLGLGKITFREGRYAAADDLIRRALEADDRSAEAHFYKGRLVENAGDCKAALAQYDRAIELEPSLAEAFFHRGFCRMKLNDCAGAVPDFKHAIALTSDATLSELASGYVEKCR